MVIVTRLHKPIPPETSSFTASVVNALTVEPVYAPSKVSKSLPYVVNSRVPASVATHLYQRDAEGIDPPCNGSPVSRVAVRVELVK